MIDIRRPRQWPGTKVAQIHPAADNLNEISGRKTWAPSARPYAVNFNYFVESSTMIAVVSMCSNSTVLPDGHATCSARRGRLCRRCKSLGWNQLCVFQSSQDEPHILMKLIFLWKLFVFENCFLPAWETEDNVVGSKRKIQSFLAVRCTACTSNSHPQRFMSVWFKMLIELNKYYLNDVQAIRIASDDDEWTDRERQWSRGSGRFRTQALHTTRILEMFWRLYFDWLQGLGCVNKLCDLDVFVSGHGLQIATNKKAVCLVVFLWSCLDVEHIGCSCQRIIRISTAINAVDSWSLNDKKRWTALPVYFSSRAV